MLLQRGGTGNPRQDGGAFNAFVIRMGKNGNFYKQQLNSPQLVNLSPGAVGGNCHMNGDILGVARTLSDPNKYHFIEETI